MWARSVLVGVVVALWCVAVGAEPSFLGYTGLVFVPTADTLAARRLNAAWRVDTEAIDFSSTYTVAYGVLEQLELSFVRLPSSIAGSSTSLLNLKLRFDQPLFGKHTQVAAGLIDVADESKNLIFFGRVNGGTRGYLVASGDLWKSQPRNGNDTFLVRGHMGFIAGRGRNNLFVGAEVHLAPSLSLFGEVFENDYNVGATLRLTRRISVEGFVVNLRDPDVIVGISYNQRW